MRVSFKGLANVSTYQTDSLSQGTKTDKLIFQVNNEGEHKDLDNFKAVLRAFPDPYNKNFINMEFKTLNNGNYGITINSRPFYMFSNKSDEYKVKNEEIDKKKWTILSNIFQVVKRIKKGEEKFPINNGYLASSDCYDRLDCACLPKLQYADENSIEDFIVDCHISDNLRTNAKKILPNLQARLEELETAPKIYSNAVENISGFQIETNKFKSERLLMKLSDSDIEKLGPAYKAYKRGSNRELAINTKIDLETNEKIVTVNQYHLPINAQNMQMVTALSEKLKQISNEKHALSFPYEYKTLNHLDKLYTGYDKNQMINLTFADKETTEAQGVYFDICENSSDIKSIAKTMANMIDKKIEEEIFERNI